MTGLQKSSMWAQNKSPNKIKSLSLLQNLMGFLLKFMEMGYHIQSWRCKQNITQCNLRSHAWLFLQTWSHMLSNSSTTKLYCHWCCHWKFVLKNIVLQKDYNSLEQTLQNKFPTDSTQACHRHGITEELLSILENHT